MLIFFVQIDLFVGCQSFQDFRILQKEEVMLDENGLESIITYEYEYGDDAHVFFSRMLKTESTGDLTTETETDATLNENGFPISARIYENGELLAEVEYSYDEELLRLVGSKLSSTIDLVYGYGFYGLNMHYEYSEDGHLMWTEFSYFYENGAIGYHGINYNGFWNASLPGASAFSWRIQEEVHDAEYGMSWRSFTSLDEQGIPARYELIQWGEVTNTYDYTASLNAEGQLETLIYDEDEETDSRIEEEYTYNDEKLLSRRTWRQVSGENSATEVVHYTWYPNPLNGPLGALNSTKIEDETGAPLQPWWELEWTDSERKWSRYGVDGQPDGNTRSMQLEIVNIK